MAQLDPQTETAVRRFLALLDKRYNVADVLVYGSRSRGTHRIDSDADVAVLLQGDDQPFITTKLDMADTAFDVLLETGILVSPLPISLQDWQNPDGYVNPALLRHIAHDGVHI